MENKVLAKVGSREITESELNAVIAKYPAEQRGMVESEMGRKQLLEQMIAMDLFNELGSDLKINETAEYKEVMANIGKQILSQMTIEKVMNDVIVTDEEISKHYEDNKESFAEKATVSAKHILVDSEEKAKEIKAKIDNGEVSFEDAATEYSSCPSKEQGGNLGEFGRGMMVPEFEEAAFEAEMGVVTEPVKTQFGYHLIKVEAKNDAKVKEFDEVKEAVKQQLMQQAQQEKYLQLTKELEAKFGVVRN